MSAELRLLEKNAKILANRFPNVLSRILETGNRASSNFFYQQKNGNAILMMFAVVAVVLVCSQGT